MFQFLGKGIADIAGNRRRNRQRCKHPRNKGRCCRLAVRSRNAHPVAFIEAACIFCFTNDFEFLLAGFFYDICRKGDPCGNDEKLALFQRVSGVFGKDDFPTPFFHILTKRLFQILLFIII